MEFYYVELFIVLFNTIICVTLVLGTCQLNTNVLWLCIQFGLIWNA